MAIHGYESLAIDQVCERRVKGISPGINEGLGASRRTRGRICANLNKEDTDGQDVVAYITGAKTQPEYADAAA